MVGNTTMVQELAAKAPNPADQVGYLLRQLCLAAPAPLRRGDGRDGMEVALGA